MTRARSRYDDLHDKYYALLSSKAGTRYERLAAVVFKALDEQKTVIHDLRLIGDSGVGHQIDVTIERDGVRRRILIECKDFDLSGDKVGLDVARNFFGVVEDLAPEESYIISCNGFTADSIRYCEAKGIRLAVLREFRDADWDGRVRRFVVDMRMLSAGEPTLALGLNTDADIEKLTGDLEAIGASGGAVWKHQDVSFVREGVRTPAIEFIQRHRTYDRSTPDGLVEHDIDVEGLAIEVETRGPIPIAHLRLSYEVLRGGKRIIIGGDKIGVLLLQRLGAAPRAIWDDELRRFRIADSGEIM
jgi:hypothetical protein